MKRHTPTPFSATLAGLAALVCAVVLLAACAGPSEVPTATARYETDGAVVNVGLPVHGYTWDNQVADAYSPTETPDEDVVDIEVSGTDELSVSFSAEARRAEVWRYDEDPDGESVECDLEDGVVSLVPEPGWRYRVYAQFMDGEADYLFDATGTEGGDAAEQDGMTSTAMVVTLGNGQLLFVDQETGSPYFPTLPEGSPELEAGNVVRVTGNGIMLESYPAQYPGIYEVEVVEEGSPEDAEKYADLVAQLDANRDPADPPAATVEYAADGNVTSISPMVCASIWTFEQDGKTQAVTTDAPHPVQYEADGMPALSVDATAEVTARFDEPATGASATRYRESDIAAAARAAGTVRDVDPSTVAGEAMDATVADGVVRLTVAPGYRYALEVGFDAGTATYVFTVPE